MSLKNYKFEIEELYNYYKSSGSDISRNGIIWMTTLLKSGISSQLSKVMFDLGVESLEILILFLASKEEYEICAALRKKVDKHKEITV